jgi:alanine dehydrogenase
VRVGIPKEIKSQEFRVGATPDGVGELVEDGHVVIVEQGAGVGSGFDDAAYLDAGAQLGTARDAWSAALVVKIKEPTPSEYSFFRGDLTLFTYLHLAADRALTEALIEAGTTAIAYETIRSSTGTLPLLAPMSEIAGRLAVQSGVGYLLKSAGGRGVLVGAVPGIAPARVVIVGGGVVGYHAAIVALGLGASVQVFDKSVERLRDLDHLLSSRAELLVPTRRSLAAAVAQADLVIGAVLVAGARAPKVISEAMVASMRPGSVLCDVAIDQGGCCETSRATTYDAPVYEVHGVTHYCVANLPGAVPVSSTLALTNVTLPYARELARCGWRSALNADSGFAEGLNVSMGSVTHPAVAAALDVQHRCVGDVLSSETTQPLGAVSNA